MKYTIAIPAYKKKFLKKCIQSILKQDFVDFELIIVNDASPEDLDEIVSEFDDHRIKYFKNLNNCGAENVVDNWNICLSYAKGDFFVLMGDDDELMPDFLSTFDLLIQKYPDQNVYHCRSFVIDDQSNVLRLTSSWPEWESVYENIFHRMSNLRNQYISDFMYKKEFLLRNGGFYKLPLAWASDDITSFLAAKEKGIVHIQKPVFCYRESNVTLSSSGSVDLKLKAIDQEQIWYHNFLKNNVPENDIDVIFYKNIKLNIKKYFLSKKIDTIAYNGITKKNFFRNYFHYFKKRKEYGLTLQTMIYVLILAIKKYKSNNL